MALALREHPGGARQAPNVNPEAGRPCVGPVGVYAEGRAVVGGSDDVGGFVLEDRPGRAGCASDVVAVDEELAECGAELGGQRDRIPVPVRSSFGSLGSVTASRSDEQPPPSLPGPNNPAASAPAIRRLTSSSLCGQGIEECRVHRSQLIVGPLLEASVAEARNGDPNRHLACRSADPTQPLDGLPTLA